MYDQSKDQNLQTSTSVTSQARNAFAVTPHDDTDLDTYAKALYIGITGDVTIIPVVGDDDTPITFTAHPVGYMPVQVRRILATGTTASSIVALVV